MFCRQLMHAMIEYYETFWIHGKDKWFESLQNLLEIKFQMT